MSEHVHILITGEEGKGRSFVLSKRKIKSTAACMAGLLLTFGFTSYSALRSIKANVDLNNEVASLNGTIDGLADELDQTTSSNKALALQVSELKDKNATQAELFKQEKADLLNTAVTELEERSDMIERIMTNIGVDVDDTPVIDSSNSGGPFVKPSDDIGKELLFRSDTYLNTIQFLPLGRPVSGSVSSKFGLRIDPLNNKRGFHTGVDLRGHTGDPIRATADGTVAKAFRNGGYGKYVEINHGNGYSTKYAHMNSITVKRGENVQRGQKIGTVGNTGRSTGSHLHYEICLHGKPINPSQFMHSYKLKQAAAIKTLTSDQKTKIKHRLVAKNNVQPESTDIEK